MALDIKLFYLLNNLAGKYGFFDSLVIFLAEYLSYFLIAIFLLLLFFSGYIKREKLYLFWVTAISATIARFGVTEFIRFFYHRPRPFSVLPAHQLIIDNSWSFPSGHSTFFFAMAAAVYCYNKKWGIGFFVAALLMNTSRVIAGVHYPSDILGGMIIGITVAYIVFYFAHRKELKDALATQILDMEKPTH